MKKTYREYYEHTNLCRNTQETFSSIVAFVGKLLEMPCQIVFQACFYANSSTASAALGSKSFSVIIA